MRQRIAFLAFCVLILAVGPVQAADLGARAMGMGGAYVALANDATAVYWNPAGLAEVSFISVAPVGALETSARGDLESFHQLTGGDKNVALPTGDFTLEASGAGLAGIVTKRFGVTYLPEGAISADYVYRSEVPLGYTEPVPGNGSTMTANATVYNNTIISGAMPLARAPFGLAAINLGANVKFIKAKHLQPESADSNGTVTLDVTNPNQLNEPVRMVEDATGNGIGLDLGVQGRFTDRVRFGAVARDVVRSIEWSGDSQESRKPAVQAGIAVKAPLGLTVAADVENLYLDGDRATRFRLGLEESILGLVAVRAGYRSNPGGDPSYSVGLGAGLGKFLRLEAAVASDLQEQFQACLTAIAQF